MRANPPAYAPRQSPGGASCPEPNHSLMPRNPLSEASERDTNADAFGLSEFMHLT
jgi:hypothetical protein